MGVVDTIEWAYVTLWSPIQNELVEQWICIKFCVNPECSSMQLFGWCRRPQLLATGNWQIHHNNASTHASRLMQRVLQKQQITQVTQPVQPSPDLAPYDFWVFPKIKSPLKGKRFQTINKTQENMTGHLMVTGKTVTSQSAYCEGDQRCHCPMYSVSCIL